MWTPSSKQQACSFVLAPCSDSMSTSPIWIFLYHLLCHHKYSLANTLQSNKNVVMFNAYRSTGVWAWLMQLGAWNYGSLHLLPIIGRAITLPMGVVSGNNPYFHASKLISQAWMRTLVARGKSAATTIAAVLRSEEAGAWTLVMILVMHACI